MGTVKQEQKKVGIEFEFPVVFSDGRAADRAAIKKLWRALSARDPQWTPIREVRRKVVTGIERTQKGYTEVINSDGGVSIVEFSLRPAQSVQECIAHFHEVFRPVYEEALRLGLHFLTMGSQPVTGPDWQRETEKDWYLLLNHVVPNHHYANLMASHQAAVDVDLDSWVPAVNVLNGLSGLQVALTAGAPFWMGKPSGRVEVRDLPYRKMSAGLSKKYYGQYMSNGVPSRPFTDLDDYLRFFWSSKLFMVTERKSDGYRLVRPQRIIDFLSHPEPQEAFDIQGAIAMVSPQDEFLHSLHEYGWISAKVHYFFKSSAHVAEAAEAFHSGRLDLFLEQHFDFGYVENRPCSVGLQGTEGLFPALTTGLVQNYKKANRLLRSESWDFWRNLRKEAEQRGLDFATQKKKKRTLATTMVEIAFEGLEQRGYGEEQYLWPLYDRLSTGTTPADQMVASYKTHGMKHVINRYSMSYETT